MDGVAAAITAAVLVPWAVVLAAAAAIYRSRRRRDTALLKCRRKRARVVAIDSPEYHAARRAWLDVAAAAASETGRVLMLGPEDAAGWSADESVSLSVEKWADATELVAIDDVRRASMKGNGRGH